MGTCLMRQTLVTSTPCTCTTNLQPADGSGYTMHLSCSYSSTQTCLGTYNYSLISATAISEGHSAEVQSVSFAIDLTDRLASKTSATVTLGFTPATSIPSGGTITLNYPAGFFASSVLPKVAVGASSIANLRAWSSLTTASSIVITTIGATIEALPFTITISGFTMGAATLAASGINVQTSSDPNTSSSVASGQIFGRVLNQSFSMFNCSGRSDSVVLSFTPATPVLSGGSITLNYPSGLLNLSITPWIAPSASSVLNLTALCIAATDTFTIFRTSGANIVALPFTITISGFIMDAAAAGTSAASVSVQTSSDSLESIAAVSAAGLDMVSSVIFTINETDRVPHKSNVSVTLSFRPNRQIQPGGTITLHFPPGFFSSFSTPASRVGTSIEGLSLTFSVMTSSSVVISTSGSAIVQDLPFTITIGGMTLGNQTTGAGVIVQTSSDPCNSLPVPSGPIVLSCPVFYDSMQINKIDDAPYCPVGTLACLTNQIYNQRYCYYPAHDIMVSTYMIIKYDYCPKLQIGTVGGNIPFEIAGVIVWRREQGKDGTLCPNLNQ